MANRGQEIGLERQPAVTCVGRVELAQLGRATDRKSTRLNSSHGYISYAVFCLKKKIIVSRIVYHEQYVSCRSANWISASAVPLFHPQILAMPRTFAISFSPDLLHSSYLQLLFI